jgi:hypothetical protein
MAVWRPEAAVLIDPADTTAPALRGRIELVTFLGPITRLDVRVAGDDEPILVDVVSAVAGHLEAGQAVAISVPPEAIRVYA